MILLLKKNFPKHAISTLAKDLNADLIVIGSHGHHGLIRNFLGSTASAVVNHAPCDVFVVKVEKLK